jgi:hypothetical protein
MFKDISTKPSTQYIQQPMQYSPHMDIALVLYTGKQAGINNEDLLSLLNKSLDISNSEFLIKKMEYEQQNNRIKFDYYFILSGTLFSTIGIIILLYYFQTLIESCSSSFISLVGNGANYGISGVELLARNTVPFFWNNLLMIGNKIGNITNTFNISDTYKIDYTSESILSTPINQTVEAINSNAELAAFIVNIILFLLLVFIFVMLTIFLLKISQLRKLTLSFLFWKMDTELRS